MSTPPLTNNFNGGTDGVDIFTDSSVGGGNAFDSVTGGFCYYSNVQSHSGGMAMRQANPTNTSGVIWNGWSGITTDFYTRFYLYMPALPSDNNFYPLRIGPQTDIGAVIIRILSSGNGGVLQLRDNTNTQFGSNSAVGVAASQWVRIETHLNCATTTWEYRLFNTADSTTADATGGGAGCSVSANAGNITFGINVTTPASFTVYFDDVAISTVGWIGPAVSNQILRPDADLTVGGWSSAPLYSKLNDSSDSTYITETSS